jgi:hypothetical protein
MACLADLGVCEAEPNRKAQRVSDHPDDEDERRRQQQRRN